MGVEGTADFAPKTDANGWTAAMHRAQAEELLHRAMNSMDCAMRQTKTRQARTVISTVYDLTKYIVVLMEATVTTIYDEYE